MNEWKLESLPKTSKECVELLGSNFIGDFFKKKKQKKKKEHWCSSNGVTISFLF